jgi:HK97 family phage major capsid protein
MDSLKKLYEQRARVHEQMKDRAKEWNEIVERGEDIPEDQNTEYDLWDKEYDSLTEGIDRIKKLEAIEAKDLKREDPIPLTPEKRDIKAEYSEIFRSYCLKGLRGLSDEKVEMLERHFVSEKEYRAATPSSTTDAAGGYTIAEDFSYEVEKFAAFQGPFADTTGAGAYRLWQSDSGADLPYPTVDDTGNDSYLLAESGNATSSATGVTFGTETLSAYAFNTGVIPVTKQLIQDSDVGFLSLLAELLGERAGRGRNTACTTGTGSSQPEGCTIGSSQGASTASSTAFTHNEMVEMLYSLNKAYRTGPKVGWMMHPTIVGEIRKLDVSASNVAQPMFQPALSADVPDRIMGYQYWENGAMASTLTTGQKIAMFGDWNKFVIRRVRGFEILRSDERYFELLQVAFMGWERFDSRVMNEDALKYFELT